MTYKQRLFIYDRREIAVFLLLIFMISMFTFTLGVHFGKQAGVRSPAAETPETTAVQESPDMIPSPQELADHAKTAQEGLEESLNQDLQEEVSKTGIKLSTPRQVDLPNEAKTPNAGATRLSSPARLSSPRKPYVKTAH